jgi:hypothetical protein
MKAQMGNFRFVCLAIISFCAVSLASDRGLAANGVSVNGEQKSVTTSFCGKSKEYQSAIAMQRRASLAITARDYRSANDLFDAGIVALGDLGYDSKPGTYVHDDTGLELAVADMRLAAGKLKEAADLKKQAFSSRLGLFRFAHSC